MYMLRRYANVESLKALRSVSWYVRWKLDTLGKEVLNSSLTKHVFASHSRINTSDREIDK